MNAGRRQIPKHFWRNLYRYVAELNREFDFMNYGFAGTASLVLDPADEPERYGFQLYDRVVGGVSLDGTDLIEVGSGRGGGARFLTRYGAAARYTGFDFSVANVFLSRRRFEGSPFVRFVVGDAEHLPLREASASAIINVESSHCYGDRTGFFADVKRTLRPGGWFLFADLFEGGQRPEPLFESAGLRIERCDEITSGVLAALAADSERRRAFVAAAEPHRRTLLESWAGVEGLPVYESFRTGESRYWAVAAQRRAPG